MAYSSLPDPDTSDLSGKPEGKSLAQRAGRAGRIGMLALAVGFGGFMLWAVFAPLDEGVVAPGSVTVDTKRKAVQHLSGGIVREVLVQEGEQVKEGQVVARLDSGVVNANHESSRQRYYSLRALEARLIAEQSGARQVTWHPDLQEGGKDPLIRQQMSLQEQLLVTRRAAIEAELASIQEAIRGQEGMVQTYRAMAVSRKAQSNLLEEELRNMRPLVADGYAPRNRQLELERAVADLLTAQTELQGSIVRSQQSIAELRQRATARQQEYRKEVEGQRADVTREVQAEAAKFAALQADLARVEIRSPATGQVVGLAMQTAGGVIGPGQKLMDVVPSDAPLLLEARVPPHVIDRVRSGLPVDIRFSTFAHTPTLVVDGQVTSISADLIVEPQTNMAYYLARVAVTPEGQKKLGKRQMQPGMPAEVIIRTGERSLLTYLAGPLIKRVAASMKEE